MTKRKNRKTQKRKSTKKHLKKPSNTKLINILLIIIIFLIIIIGIILFNLDSKRLKEVNTTAKETTKKVEKKVNKELDKYFDEIKIKKDKFEEYTDHFYEEYIDKETVEKLKDQVESVTQEIQKPNVPDTKEEVKKETPKKTIVKDTPKAVLTNKPKLAIVIDDVTTSYQLNKIKNLGYTTTPSFLPPTKRHPNSSKIAQDLEFYMIHFPLQATSFNNEENNTLHIGDSYEKIEKRVAQIRQWYPNAKYTNNHTGSKFTENKESMNKLFKALVKHDFIFMDSRTTSKTVAKQMASKYNMPYIVRNVFLDNEQDFNYIQNQLKKAIKIAKKNGFAIAICHPHSITLKTLKESKHLLDDLEMVYLNQLPFLNK